MRALPDTDTKARRRREGGYVLLTIMLLGALLMVGTAGLSRHALLGEAEGLAGLKIHRSREASLSAVVYARQALASRRLPTSEVLNIDDVTVDIALTRLADDRHALAVDAFRGDLGSTLRGEIGTEPATDGPPPELTPEAVTAINTSSNRITLRDGAVLADQEIVGILVIAPGASVTLENILLHGSIVSGTALSAPPYAPGDATALRIVGGLRIEPTAELEDVAIYMPDGAVFGEVDSGVEIHGVTAADTLSLLGRAYVHDPMLVRTIGRADDLEQPGQGRGPSRWPEAFADPPERIRWMAFPRAAVTRDEQAAIGRFAFP